MQQRPQARLHQAQLQQELLPQQRHPMAMELHRQRGADPHASEMLRWLVLWQQQQVQRVLSTQVLLALQLLPQLPEFL